MYLDYQREEAKFGPYESVLSSSIPTHPPVYQRGLQATFLHLGLMPTSYRNQPHHISYARAAFTFWPSSGPCHA